MKRTEMKKQILQAIGVASFGVVTLLASTQVWVSAQVDNGKGLVGSWDVTITPRDCDTGEPAPFPPAFSAVQTYNQGGTMTASVQPNPGITFLEGHGVWEHRTGRQYSIAARILKYDPDGSSLGKDVIRDLITLDPSGDSYTSTGGVDVGGPDGSVLFHGCATTAATRFE